MTSDRGARPVADKMVCFEAVRGLASFSVLVSHVVLGFWPGLYFRQGLGWSEFPVVVQVLARFPGRFLWDGQVAVSLFFVLSGFVLSLSFCRDGSVPSLGSAAVRRYPRLMFPVAASVLLAFTLLSTGTMSNQEAVRFMNEAQGLHSNGSEAPGFSNIWLTCHYNFPPDYLAAMREAVWGAFASVAFYNQVLWTMPIELKGSFLVYGFLALFGRLHNRWLLYAILGGLFLLNKEFFYLEFLLGMVLCELWVHNSRTWRKSLAPAPALALIAIGLFAVPWKPGISFLVVGAVAASPRLQQLFAASWLAWLGRVSFGLYLVHVPILCSLGCGVYLTLCRDVGWTHNTGALGGAIACMSCSLVAAWIFYHAVDRPTIALTRRLDNWLFRPRGQSGVSAGQAPASMQAEDRRPQAA
jgi:peptidoglycan/LPS O-acetylase OafA/YrhL